MRHWQMTGVRRRTGLYAAALVIVAGGAVALETASGADVPEAPPARAHRRPLPSTVGPAEPVASAVSAPSEPATVPAAADTVVVEREIYDYTGTGRRDPFRSLIVTAALRPLPSELRLVAVAYDPTGERSVAILRDATTKAQHRVRVGEAVGRMRVVRIRPRTVVFAVEELGFSRTEVVTLSDSSSAKQP